MSSAIASTTGIQVMLPLVRSDGQCTRQPKLIGSHPIRPRPVKVNFRPFGRRRPISNAIQAKFAPVRCAASLNARCGATQTQTVTRRESTISIFPTQGKEKSPKLDDGGSGFPPRDDGGGGGGGGGGGFSGGFFLFAFLAFMGFLKDKESDNEYQDDRRRRENYL